MDAYNAPYKPKHHYWPGLLLVLCFDLFWVFVFNPQEDPSINLLGILVGTWILTVWSRISGAVYMNWCLNALESWFTVNLIILVGATYHVKLSGGNQLGIGYTSVIIRSFFNIHWDPCMPTISSNITLFTMQLTIPCFVILTLIFERHCP